MLICSAVVLFPARASLGTKILDVIAVLVLVSQLTYPCSVFIILKYQSGLLDGWMIKHCFRALRVWPRVVYGNY